MRRGSASNGNRRSASSCERLIVGSAVDAQRAEHAQLLVDDLIRIEIHSGPACTTRSRDDDCAAGPRELDRLCERGGCLGCDVHDDVGQPSGRVTQRAHGIAGIHVDGKIRAELRRRSRAGVRRAVAASGHHHEAGTRALRRRAGRQPAHSGTEDRDNGAGAQPRHGHRPANARAQRVEHRRGDRVERRRYRSEHRIGCKVLMLCVAAPESGTRSTFTNPYMSARPWRSQRWEAPARHAPHERHDKNTSTATRSPACTPQRAAARDPIRSMMPTDSCPGTNGYPGKSSAGVFLVIRAAEAARFDSQETVVVADLGKRKLTHNQTTR